MRVESPAQREARLVRIRENYWRNRDARRIQIAAWQRANPENNRARQKKWAKTHAVAAKAKSSKWAKANPHYGAQRVAKYYAAKQRSTAPWADRDVIADIYRYAAIMREHGVECDVDHIVPIQGELVSGLHTHDNLTVLPASVNRAKGNRHAP